MNTQQFVNDVLRLTNEFRTKNGVAPLKLNPKLTTAAQGHSEDMAHNDIFSHKGSDGSLLGDRAREAGYDSNYKGENIAIGSTTPEDVVRGWLNSSGHRENILDEQFTELGIGYEYLENDTGKINLHHYWTQLFGSGDTNSDSKLPKSDNKDMSGSSSLKTEQKKDVETGEAANDRNDVEKDALRKQGLTPKEPNLSESTEEDNHSLNGSTKGLNTQANNQVNPSNTNMKFVNEVLRLTNEFRAKHGAGPLKINTELNAAAQDHSEDMAKEDFFSHNGLDGSKPWDRAKDVGYESSGVGENIAAGQTTPERVVQGWINSPGHRANMLNKDFTELGVGYEHLENDTGNVNYGHYWTQLFGAGDTNPNSNVPSSGNTKAGKTNSNKEDKKAQTDSDLTPQSDLQKSGEIQPSKADKKGQTDSDFTPQLDLQKSGETDPSKKEKKAKSDSDLAPQSDLQKSGGTDQNKKEKKAKSDSDLAPQSDMGTDSSQKTDQSKAPDISQVPNSSDESTPKSDLTTSGEKTILEWSENTLRGSHESDTLDGRTDDDKIVGRQGDDTIKGAAGNDILAGSRGADKIYGDGGNDYLRGGLDSDQLFGGEGDDVLRGTSRRRGLGQGEVDTFTGGEGADTFVLGHRETVYYNDSDTSNQSIGGYALITDFNAEQRDVIRLSDDYQYSLGAAPKGVESGQGIFINSGSGAGDLIAVVQGNTELNLDSPAFEMV